MIVFVVTSYSEYLDEAMRFHVFRYLSKPLDKQRFFRNLKDALAYYNSITLKIPVETKQAVYSFPASQIIAIEAQGRKVIVHTARQDFDSIHNMNYWLEKLPQTVFFRHTGALLLTSNILWTLITPPYIYQILRLPLTWHAGNTVPLEMHIYYIWKAWGENKWNILFYFIFSFFYRSGYLMAVRRQPFFPLLIAVKRDWLY